MSEFSNLRPLTSMRVPKYRKHSTRDFAFVEVDGKRIRLPGPHGSAESRDAYAEIVRRIATDKEAPLPPIDTSQVVTVRMVALAWLAYCKKHYAAGGKTGEYANAKYAVRHLTDAYGGFSATNFGPLKLKDLQRRMAADDQSRTYINQVVAKIKRAFKWAASEEVIPVEVYHALATVPGLQVGRTTARETAKKRPVDWRHVEAVLPLVPPTVANMIWLQWHTGVRADSVCMATRAQFDRSADPWLWRPKHKNQFRGVELILPVGPKCRELLQPILETAKTDEEFLFSPRAIRPNRRYRARYGTHSYRQAIQRAIDRFNDVETEAAKKEFREPALIPSWSPHQLRHAKGHAVRNQFGLEAAQAILGHESVAATQIYSERRLELAKLVAKETG